MEKWNDRKLVGKWKNGRMEKFSFPSCVFGWKGGKVGGWKSGRVKNSFVWLKRKVGG